MSEQLTGKPQRCWWSEDSSKVKVWSIEAVDGRNPAPVDMGGSKNRGTPKWMVYNGKPY